jgi:hypothetical protein
MDLAIQAGSAFFRAFFSRMFDLLRRLRSVVRVRDADRDCGLFKNYWEEQTGALGKIAKSG